MNWPWKRKEVRIVNSPFEAIKLADWRRSPLLVHETKKLLNVPHFRALLATLRLESPANYSFAWTGVSQEDRAAHAERIAGYNLCLANLEIMAEMDERSKPLDAAFEPEKRAE